MANECRKQESVSYYDFVRSQFFRPLNWRWEIAQRIAVGERFPPGVRDPLIPQLASLINYINAGVELDASSRAAEKYLFAAYSLWKRPQYAALCLEVKARILAGQGDQEIERETSLPQQVSALFEACFFQIRDRLQSKDWIGGFVIGKMRLLEVLTDEETILFDAFCDNAQLMPILLLCQRTNNSESINQVLQNLPSLDRSRVGNQVVQAAIEDIRVLLTRGSTDAAAQPDCIGTSNQHFSRLQHQAG